MTRKEQTHSQRAENIGATTIHLVLVELRK